MPRNGTNLSTSPRLQQLLKLLSDGKPHSSMEIIRKVVTVNPATCIADLRDNGAEITCERRKTQFGRSAAYYTMTKAPKT